MKRNRTSHLSLWILGGVVVALMAISLACAAAEPTPTPVPPAPPAPPVAPTAAPAPAPTLAPGAATSVPTQPTPTRALPTPTPAIVSKVQSGGTLRHAMSIAFDTLDGHVNTRFELQPILYAIYDNIVKLGPDGSIQPDLAESWNVSQDGKTITFRFRKGVKFQDGTDFNASAVKWNIDRILNPASGATAQRSILIGSIDRVEVPDDYTAIFKLKTPSRSFLSVLAERSGHTLSPTAVDKLGRDFAIRPVGTGPFKVNRWLLGDSNTMEKFDNYWEKGKPYLDKVVIQDVPDISVQLAMVRTGETDVVTYITPVAIRIVEGNPSLKIVPVLGRVHGFKMTVTKPPYDNKALRQAIGYAFDEEEFLKTYFEGRGQAGYSLIAPGNWAYNPDIVLYKPDLAKSKQKLAEAGYPSGVTVPVWCGSVATEILRCEIFQTQLKRAGINTELKVVLQADYFNSMRADWKGERTLAGQYFWSPRGDPAQSVQRVFHSKGGSNSHDYANPEVDKLIDEGETVYDIAKAKAIYDRVQRLILEDGVFIPHAFPPEYTVMTSKLQGFAQPPDLRLRVKDLWLQR